MFTSRSHAHLGLALVLATSTSLHAEPEPPPPLPSRVTLAPFSETKPAIVRVRNLATGQDVPVASLRRGQPRGPSGRGGGTVVFDNYSNPNSAAHLNVSYFNPGSYNGSDPSTVAIVLPMADRLAARAPSDPAMGLPVPTDIVWNEYVADASAWPGGASALNPLKTLSLVCYISNIDPPSGGGPPQRRFDVQQVRFFSQNGLVERGGFEVTYDSLPNYTAYFGDEFDLSGLVPAIEIPRTGLVMMDWTTTNAAGVGSMYAGGDLINAMFPRPETLRSVGTTDVETMRWADGIVGIGGYPNVVNPAFDGDPSSTSYLDVLNTGAIVNWFIHIGEPPIRMLCRDFPCRIVVDTAGAPECPCDVNSSGFVNSQDFFDFIASFFMNNGDFNGSGATDSQDFFDFLTCFFSGC